MGVFFGVAKNLFGGSGFVGGFSQAGFFAGGRFPMNYILFGSLVNARFRFFQIFVQRSGGRSNGGFYGFGGHADLFNQPFILGSSLLSLALGFQSAGMSTGFQFSHLAFPLYKNLLYILYLIIACRVNFFLDAPTHAENDTISFALFILAKKCVLWLFLPNIYPACVYFGGNVKI